MQELSTSHLILFLSLHIVASLYFFSSLHSSRLSAQTPKLHLTMLGGQVFIVGHKNFALVQEPSEHLVKDLSMHLVWVIALSQSSLFILQDPSLH